MKKRHKGIFKYVLAALLASGVILTGYFGQKMVLKQIYPLRYGNFVYKYSELYNLDPYFVFAIIKAESNFNPRATSGKNARGLMQITDKTGRWIAWMMKLEYRENESLYDPETNIGMGCWYLCWLMKQFNNDTDLVIAAYNGGSGRVNEWLKDKNLSMSGSSLDRIPFKETNNFLFRVKNNYSIYKKLYE